MTSSELSITLSIAQLLQFDVCASLCEGQPSLQLVTSPQPSLPVSLQELDLVNIRIETQVVDGKRTLRVCAISKSGSSSKNDTPQNFSSEVGYLLQDSIAFPDIIAQEPSVSACSNIASAATSPVAFESSLAGYSMSNVDYELLLTSFATSDNYTLGSSDPPAHRKDALTSHDGNGTSLFKPHNGMISTLDFPTTANTERLDMRLRQLSNPSQLPSPSPSECSTSISANVSRKVTKPSHHEKEPGGTRRRARRFACLDPECSRRFASKYTLGLHMSTHRSDRNVRHLCQMGCTETFSRQHDRLRHEVSQHGRVSEWTCNRCKHVFSSQSTYDKHKCPDLAGEGVYR